MRFLGWQNSSHRRARGFSIIELMVAMTLSLVLLGGVIALFTSSKASYENTDRLSRIQENGRFALDEITRRVRSSGFIGCARRPLRIGTSLVDAGDAEWNFLEGPIRGYQWDGSGWSPALPAMVTGAAEGSDVLVVRGPARDAEPLQLTANMAAASDDIKVKNVTTGVKAGDTAMIYDCNKITFFYVSDFSAGTIQHKNGTSAPGNVAAELASETQFDTTAEVMPVATTAYFLRPSTADANVNSLWRRIATEANPEELVEGVEHLELQYGVDANDDHVVDDYVNADLVADWSKILSVRMALLVRAEQYGNDLDEQTYRLLDVDVPAPNDRRLREVFTATSTLRNSITVN
jgi:type IV pilus assembly protein PilW